MSAGALLTLTRKSLKRKSSKRSSNSVLTNNRSSSMAPSAPPFNLNHEKLISLIKAVFSVCILIYMILFSSNIRIAFASGPPLDQIYGVEVVRVFPHDPNAFTEGLLYAANDTLFESMGLNGQSSVRRVDLKTGKIEAINKMQYSYFGEGLTLLGDRLFQVTWKTDAGFIYDRNKLHQIKKFTNRMTDGWGLTTDGKVLFGSDGTSTLYKIDSQSFRVIEKHIMTYKGHEVFNINELEHVNGEVWANVWQTDCIVRISIKDSQILGWIYLPNLREGLIAAGHKGIDVLNGIAWDQEQNRIFVTGKLWPELYEIKVYRRKTPFNGNIQKLCMPKPFNF